MKLYVTPTSPYARVARIVVLEKGLDQRVAIVEAKTRSAGSPYYAINPSGRVPYLVRDDGMGLEDSQLIAHYLDHIDGRPRLTIASADHGWEAGRLEAYARSMTDGISVWVREMRRPPDEQSPEILAHEAERARRMADFWSKAVEHPVMTGPLTLAQMLLIAGLDQAAYWAMGDHTEGRPSLAAWRRRLNAIASVRATAPPPR